MVNYDRKGLFNITGSDIGGNGTRPQGGEASFKANMGTIGGGGGGGRLQSEGGSTSSYKGTRPPYVPA